MFSFSHNNINYTVRVPAYPVNLLVEHYIIMKGNGKVTERLFPNNKAEIFFNLGDKVKGINSNDAITFVNSSIVSGVRSSFFNFLPPLNYFMVGLRFTTFGFNQLFQIPAIHFTDNNFPAENVWGKEMTFLLERLYEARLQPERLFSILEEWITGCLTKCSLHEIIQWNKLEKKFYIPNLSVSGLIDRYMGYSHKHSIQLIKNNSGLSPKYIQKVIRFNEALAIISSPSFQSWCQVAYLAGYADQSHFIRDFRTFSGYTPDQYLHQKPLEYYRKDIIDTSLANR